MQHLDAFKHVECYSKCWSFVSASLRTILTSSLCPMVFSSWVIWLTLYCVPLATAITCVQAAEAAAAVAVAAAADQQKADQQKADCRVPGNITCRTGCLV
jgi:hypothetical protein